jgi:hypothetical protein
MSPCFDSHSIQYFFELVFEGFFCIRIMDCLGHIIVVAAKNFPGMPIILCIR